MSIWKRLFGHSVTSPRNIPAAGSCMNSISIPWYWHEDRRLSNEDLAHMACKEVLEEIQKEFSREKLDGLLELDRLEITPFIDKQYAFVRVFAVCSDGMAKTMEARLRARFEPKSMPQASPPTSGPVELTATFVGEVELQVFTFTLERRD
mgnify:CR=1 FL=1